MHVNFGLVPALESAPRRKDDRRRLMAERARADMTSFVEERSDLFSLAEQDA